jgi:hypothetical protein
LKRRAANRAFHCNLVQPKWLSIRQRSMPVFDIPRNDTKRAGATATGARLIRFRVEFGRPSKCGGQDGIG